MTTTYPLIYFGKLPGRGDFVRSSHHMNLTHAFDAWLSKTIERMIANNQLGWKEIYDGLAPVNFAFFGKASKHVLVGSLAQSHDSSNRRFPFLCCIAHPLESLPSDFSWLPHHFSEIWQQTNRWLQIGLNKQLSSDQMDADLNDLNAAQIHLTDKTQVHQTMYLDFLNQTDFSGLAKSFDQQPSISYLRQRILGSGLLLEPLLKRDMKQAIAHGLHFPMGSDPSLFQFQFQFWFDLAFVFFKKMPKEEFAIFNYRRMSDQQNQLVFGFHGCANEALYAAFFNNENNFLLDFDKTSWIEEEITKHNKFAKLSSYLDMADLRLTRLKDTFSQTFDN